MKVRDVVKMIENDGWFLVRIRGSHSQKPGTVTVSGKEGLDMPPGTLSNVLKQAGLKK